MLPQKADIYCLLWQWDWSATCMPRSEWAAWVQAFSALVALFAIGTPVFLHYREQKNEIQRSDERRRMNLQLLIATATKLDDFAVRLQAWLPQARETRLKLATRAMLGELNALRFACDRVDLQSVNSPLATDAMLLARGTVAGLELCAANLGDAAYGVPTAAREQMLRYAAAQKLKLADAILPVMKLTAVPYSGSLHAEVRIDLKAGLDWD